MDREKAVDYRAYIVDPEGHIIGLREIEAADDGSAIEEAKCYVDGHDVEVWCRDRKVKVLRHST